MQATHTWVNNAILLFAVIVMAVAFVTAPPVGNTEFMAEHIGYMLRVTARLAFALLLLAYIARPLADLLRNQRVLLRHRRHLGLAVALVMTVHFGYVCAYLVTSGEKLDWLAGIFGGAAFVLLWLMAGTSSNAARLKLGITWHRLHLFGMHYVWLIFMQTFIGVALISDSFWALAMTALGMLALSVRLAAWTAQRFRRTA
ncbi:MAG: hypothetical protein ISQ65_01500 [Pseudomonadales bacterium]|nr:hypothetical protein [Pseudomonadales bacterium]